MTYTAIQDGKTYIKVFDSTGHHVRTFSPCGGCGEITGISCNGQQIVVTLKSESYAKVFDAATGRHIRNLS